MKTPVALALAGAAGVALWLVLERKAAPVASGPTGPVAKPGDIYTGSDLGVFSPIVKLPGLAQAYGAVAPINDKIIQPLVRQINSSGFVTKINSTIGGQPTVTQNSDGTFTRTAPDTWYSRNIGSPISRGVTGAFHALGSLL